MVGLQLSSGDLLKDDCPSLNVACVGSVRTTTWGGLQLSSGVVLKVDLPSLSVACAGSSRSTSAVARCLSER